MVEQHPEEEHGAVSAGFPSQSLPPNGEAMHVRVRNFLPHEQEESQWDQPPHSPHSPAMPGKMRKYQHLDKFALVWFAFTCWHHSFYPQSSDGSCLGDIPLTTTIDMDVRELLRFGVRHGPQGFTPCCQRKYVLGPFLGLAYLDRSPFIQGRLLRWEEFANVSFSIESGADVDSAGLMDPQGWSSVSNVPTFAAYRHLQDLRKASVVVALWVEFEGHSPLLGEGGKGCQKGVPHQ